MRYQYGEYSVLPLGAFEHAGNGKIQLYGGGGFLGLGGAPSAPAAPDYSAAARDTAKGNLDASRAALAGSLISQKNPYGSLQYSKTGTDEYGNPMYTASTTLSEQGQGILDEQQALSRGLNAPQQKALGYINERLDNQFNPDLPSVGINPQETYQAAAMRTLRPQIEQSREGLEQNLANSGIAPGSKAYERAQLLQNQKEKQLLDQSTVAGFGVGLQANQNKFNQESYKRNEPVNLLASLRSGSQVTNPTFVSTPQQSVTQGADLLGAAQGQYNAQLGDFNQKQAAQANANAGFGQLAGAGLMAFCDSRLKMNIEHVGFYANIPVFDFEYLDKHKYGFETYRGFLAQDVEQIFPEAVIDVNGVKCINYSTLKDLLCQTHIRQ